MDSKEIEVSVDEKRALLDDFDNNDDEGIELRHIFFGYAILLLCVVFLVPKIYLSNSIYYVSKEINELRSRKEALKTENAELQQRLESVKFNFLTLEIEEIK